MCTGEAFALLEFKAIMVELVRGLVEFWGGGPVEFQNAVMLKRKEGGGFRVRVRLVAR